MAGKAKAYSSRGYQLYPRDFFVDPNFVTHVTTESDSGMNYFALRFVLVTGSAFRGLGVLVEWNWVYVGVGRYA